ncbi:MAG TPA: hypothetical protein VF720_05885 [Candidatus Eisenbacteria bacterium]
MRLFHRALLLILLAVTSFNVQNVQADPWDNDSKLLLHIRPPTQVNPCGAHGALDDCRDAVTSAGVLTVPAEGPYYFVYLLVGKGSTPAGVAGVRVGVTYQGGGGGGANDHVGVDVLAWRSCATLDEITPGLSVWPAPGSGITLTWDLPENCQEHATPVAGYFYLGAYSADVMTLIGDPATGDATIRSCEADMIELNESQDLGSVAFNVPGSGCNPCDAACDDMPVLPATWGSIKTLLQ